MTDWVVGVDCSTTSCKAIAWDAEGTAVAEGRASIDLANPEPDGWEQDAEQWWTATCGALRQLTEALGSDATRIAGVCMTHQRETFVVTDGAGNPRHPALVWMDSRCRPQVARAARELGADRLHQLTGKPACTTPSFYKLLFLLDRNPELMTPDARVLDVHAFLAWRLCGELRTSLACADPMGLVDLEQRDWSDELLGFAGLTRSNVAALSEPGERIGRVTDSAAAATGLPPGLSVFAGAGDGQAAGLGAGLERGQAYLNLGTAVVSGVESDRYIADSAFRTMLAATPGVYFLETDLKGGTFTLNWFAEKLAGAKNVSATLATLEEEARSIAPGSEGLVLVPYWNGVMNPFWDDDATGLVMGLRGDHSQAHFYRAVLEGIAFEQRLHTIGVDAALGSRVDSFVVMGGGARSELWCRIVADVTGRRVVRSQSSEATALGAGMLAAIGVGMHSNLESARTAMTATAEEFEPSENAATYGRIYDQVYSGLFESIRDRMNRLAAIVRA